MSVPEWWDRFVALLRGRKLDRELDDEITTHLELATAENIERGMGPEEARRSAESQFGSIATAKDNVRDHRGLPGVSSLLQDARYALRGMAKNPGFTIVATLTLSLGIGLCSMFFSVLNGMILRPVPGVPDPDELVAVRGPVTYPHFESYRDLPDLASGTAALITPVPFGVALEGPGAQPAERLFGHLVSPEYFSMLGVQPTLGRFFDPALELPGGDPVVVVSELFWRTRLRADPNAIGSALRVNGRRATIIGVGPKDFLGILGPGIVQIFVPVTAGSAIAPELADDVLHRTENPAFRVVMRLAPGVTMAAAEAALDTQAQRLDEQAGKLMPDQNEKRRPLRLMSAGAIVPIPDEARGAVVAAYGLLMGLILALTCASLAGLILARGNARGKEIAVRLSLGAGRFRLIRQLLTESFILAVTGGLTGLATAYGLIRFLAQAGVGSVPIRENMMDPDLRVVLITFLAATLASVGCGLVPALATTRPDLVTALKGASGMRRSRYRRLGLRNLFVVGQVASAMALVLVMGFLIMGLKGNVNRDVGFRTEGVYLFKLDPTRDGLSPDESVTTFTRLPEQLARLSGVESATLSDQIPLGLVIMNKSVSVPPAGADTDAQKEVHRVAIQRVGPRFFATLGVPLSRGEEFGDYELSSDPAPDAVLPVVINHVASRTLFGDADPLGRQIQQEEGRFQVIGVVNYGLPPPFQNRPAPALFLPLSQSNFRRGSVMGTSVVLRVRDTFDVAAVRRELESIDSRLTMFEARSLQASQDEFDQSVQYSASLNIGIGIFALILACVGLAGVTAQAVERRRKEIGIRMAIGAKAGQVMRLVMKEAAVMVLVGAGIGFAGAYAFARVMSSMVAEFAQIIDASAGDPLLTIGVPSLLISLAMIACYLPARRSATINPLIALREE